MTANGTEISDGESLSGSQVVRVYGSNLTPPYFSLWFNGVEYTPLDYGDGYVEYVLNDNGTATINVDGNPFMSFEIEGVVVPSRLPSYMSIGQAMAWNQPVVNKIDGTYKCINYPRMYDEANKYFVLALTKETPSWAEANFSDFEGHNCTIERSQTGTPNQMRILALVDDKDSVAWLTYQDFIIAVFNYTTTP